jgi:hypothetical protein
MIKNAARPTIDAPAGTVARVRIQTTRDRNVVKVEIED